MTDNKYDKLNIFKSDRIFSISKTALLIFCLLISNINSYSYHLKSNVPSERTISLNKVRKYANEHTAEILKIKKVTLEDFWHVEDDWIHVFQLYEPNTKTRLGKDKPYYNAYNFLICTSADIGTPLLEQKDKWFKQKVNLYLRITDRGLTVNTYVGYVVKIELLNEKNKVIKTLPSHEEQ